MTTARIYKFEDTQLVQDFLNGAVMGGKDLNGGVYGLVGKKVTIEGTLVTFAAVGGQDFFLPKDIKAQIEGAVATVKVKFHKGRLVIYESTTTNGITVTGPNDATDARDALGLEKGAVTTTGKYFVPAGGTPTAPCYTAIYFDGSAHVVVTME